eukprot:4485247-Prymnesium_polylepis.1
MPTLDGDRRAAADARPRSSVQHKTQPCLHATRHRLANASSDRHIAPALALATLRPRSQVFPRMAAAVRHVDSIGRSGGRRASCRLHRSVRGPHIACTHTSAGPMAFVAMPCRVCVRDE